MIEQHPCGDAPLVGTQLRCLIGSDLGWLGARVDAGSPAAKSGSAALVGARNGRLGAG